MNSLWGTWIFTSLIYHGTHQPLPNPDLVLTLNFYSETENIMRYYRKNEPGFCERTAKYTYDGEFLSQEILKTHPNNAEFCKSDPDMKTGGFSKNRIEFHSEKLLMHLALGDDNVIFVWTQKSSVNPHHPRQQK